jgi:hypothetical protein
MKKFTDLLRKKPEAQPHYVLHASVMNPAETQNAIASDDGDVVRAMKRLYEKAGTPRSPETGDGFTIGF